MNGLRSTSARRPAAGCAATRRSLGAACVAVAILASPVLPGEFTFGAGVPRGFFDWAAAGGYALTVQPRHAPGLVDFPLRLEGLFSSRQRVASLVASVTPTVRWRLPGFEHNNLGPYLATGIGFHVQGGWSDLREFGGVEFKGELAVKWHAFLGASLARGRRADLIVETRYTAPSQLDFDHVLVAIRIHPERSRP